MIEEDMKSKKGTSLIELLAVIIILGIIAAIAIPTTGALVKNTKNKACNRSIENIISTYQDVSFFDNEDDFQLKIDTIGGLIESSGGVRTATAILENQASNFEAKSYSGVCSEEGIYTVYYDVAVGEVVVVCSEHSDEKYFLNPDDLYGYFDDVKNLITHGCDSNAPDNFASDGRESQTGKMKQQILETYGVNLDEAGVTWLVIYRNNVLHIYYTIVDIKDKANGEKITCNDIYMSSSGQLVKNVSSLYVKTMKESGSTYNVLWYDGRK